MEKHTGADRFMQRHDLNRLDFAQRFFEINGWLQGQRELPTGLSAPEFAVAMWLAMERVEKVLDLAQQYWGRIGQDHVDALKEFADCLREDGELAGAEFMGEIAREFAEDTWCGSSTDLSIMQAMVYADEDTGEQHLADLGWQKFQKFVNEWLPRHLRKLKPSSITPETFRTLVASLDLSVFHRVADEQLDLGDDMFKVYDECVKKYMQDYEDMSVADQIRLNFQLGVMELEFQHLPQCMAAITRIPEAAVRGRPEDLFHAVILGWPLAVRLWDEKKNAMLVSRVCSLIVSKLQDFHNSTSNKDMRDASNFPAQAFGVLALLASLREQEGPSPAEKVAMARKLAAFIDDQTDGEYGFSQWVENRLKLLGFA